MLINYFKMPVVYTILGSKAPCGHTHGRTRTSLKSNLTNYVYSSVKISFTAIVKSGKTGSAEQISLSLQIFTVLREV